MKKILFLLLLFWMVLTSNLQAKNNHGNSVTLTEQEKVFIKTHPVIRVANEMDWPPFDFYEFGRPKGICIDHIKLLAEKVGLKIEFVNGYTWSELLSLVRQKQVDVMPGLYKNQERETYILFTDPYYKGQLGIFTGDHVKDIHGAQTLPGKRVGIQTSHGSIPAIYKQIPNILFTELDSPAELVIQLATGKLDAIIGNPLLFNYFAKVNQITNIRLAGYVKIKKEDETSSLLHIGIRKDWPLLHQILQKAVASVSDEEIRFLENRWSDLREEKTAKIQLTPEEIRYVQSHPVIRVSNEMDYPPYDFTIGNQPRGYSIDLLNTVAERIGINVSYINGYTWAQLVERFRNGELDLLHTINYLPDRENMGLYSEPYQQYKNHWVITRNSPEIDDVTQLFGKTVAVGKGWSHEEFLSKAYPKIRLLIVDNLESMLDAVSTGKADAMLGEVPVMQYMFKKRGITDLKLSGWAKEFDGKESRRFHFMAQHDAPELVSMLNKAIASLTPRDIQALDRKWFGRKTNEEPFVSSRIALTPDERKYLAQKGTITVSAYPGRMPFQHVDENGKLEGMGADYLALFQERIGTPFRLVPAKSTKEIHGLMQKGAVDILLMAELSEARKDHLDITTPYISSPYVIATTVDKLFIEDISKKTDHTFAVVGDTWVLEKLKRNYPSIKFLNVDSLLGGLEKVRNGEAFGYIGTSAAIGYTIQKEMMMDIKIAGTIAFDIELGIGTKRSEPLLGNIFQKAVDSLNNDDTQRIYNHWIAVKYEKGMDYSLVWKILVAALIVIAAVMFWNRKLALARHQTQKALENLNIAQNQLKMKNQELQHLAVTDGLTGLCNRMRLDQVLQNEVARFSRYGSSLSIIIMDIDFFKMINDQLGHQAEITENRRVSKNGLMGYVKRIGIHQFN